MKKEDFVFCVGFSQNEMIVDRKQKQRYGKCSSKELFEAGLYKQSFCHALFTHNEEELEWFRSEYGSLLKQEFNSLDDIKRMFGVFEVPSGVVRTIYL